MKKIIGKIVNWILVCGLLITMIPVVTKADSTYTRIMPGYTSDLATTIPVDGTDYVATFESGDIENMYFSFEVRNHLIIFILFITRICRWIVELHLR